MTIKYDEPVYQKVGRRYREVGKYVELDCLPQGAHLLVVQKGCTSRLHSIDPDKAAVLAAMKLSKEGMLTAMQEASDFKPTQTTITAEQRELLDKLKATGFNESSWIRESLQGIIDAGMKVLEVGVDD